MSTLDEITKEKQRLGEALAQRRRVRRLRWGSTRTGWCTSPRWADTYVKYPRKIATPGDVVRHKVLEVDPKRRRISLTMKQQRSGKIITVSSVAGTAPSWSHKECEAASW
jgi:transcriptional accessory protein Tex/SPT6